MLNSEIEQLEASLEVPASAQSDALAASIASRLLAVSAESPRTGRENAVRGLVVLSHHYYRVGELDRTGEMLAAAHALSAGLDGAARVSVLLRQGDFELLTWDIGAALDHTAEAMEIARASRLRIEEARAWTNYGMALQAAGLFKQGDERLAHALELLDGLDEPRLCGNIWAMRTHLGCHLEEKDFQATAYACGQALHFADASPVRFRDSMACTAWCNWAAQEILRGNVVTAKEYLANAAARSNLGVRPRWLIAVLQAMAAVRLHNGEAERAALDALLTPDKAPARAYVIETYSVMAAMYTSMADGEHAHEALVRLSTERARALWATLTVPGVFDSHPHGKPAGEGMHAVGIASMGMLERLAITAELRDDATGKHCYRVGRLSMLLARRAGLAQEDVENMDMAARLHDIGKFAIPDAILLKPGRLDAAEMRLMRTHAAIGADLLAGRAGKVLRAAEQIARHHHEYWNGGGYPAGLSGEAIPLPARIAAIADVYDALSHSRPYKVAWSHADSIAYIREMHGTQFDPHLTDLFLAIMDEAAADLAAFLADLEGAAEASPYIVAESRISKALAESVDVGG